MSEPDDVPDVGPAGPAAGETSAGARPDPDAVWPPGAAQSAPSDYPELDDGTEADEIRVRPYVITGGRTRASRDLPIEALVSTAGPAGQAATAEQQQLMQLCAQPRSIAEIAALVRVPLGVARVLVGDLAEAGAVYVHAAAVSDLDLMSRVLAGLRKL
ncbi:MAG: DUF742 domain-containing protein [Pseudonocardia sp.]|nr:DUF742 domain-containing protein [Pseudonocardia sp.]